MGDKEKHSGTKARIRARKESERQIVTALFLVFILVMTSFSAYFVYKYLNEPGQTANPSSPFKAAIVDHLSLSFPNQTFIEEATSILEQAGYAVDYYPGEEVTVRLYRNLPTHNYKLIILRVHSGFIFGGGTTVFLFSSESYSTKKYLYEQLTDQIAITRISAGEPIYFGINDNFVKSSMEGRFNDAAIIMMGCNGLTHTTMAEAFIQKGAQAYISWEEAVSASHTDQATTRLLQNLLTKKQTINQAVENTMKEVGADPTYKSTLSYYPREAGEQTIEDTTSKP